MIQVQRAFHCSILATALAITASTGCATEIGGSSGALEKGTTLSPMTRYLLDRVEDSGKARWVRQEAELDFGQEEPRFTLDGSPSSTERVDTSRLHQRVKDVFGPAASELPAQVFDEHFDQAFGVDSPIEIFYDPRVESHDGESSTGMRTAPDGSTTSWVDYGGGNWDTVYFDADGNMEGAGRRWTEEGNRWGGETSHDHSTRRGYTRRSTIEYDENGQERHSVSELRSNETGDTTRRTIETNEEGERTRDTTENCDGDGNCTKTSDEGDDTTTTETGADAEDETPKKDEDEGICHGCTPDGRTALVEFHFDLLDVAVEHIFSPHVEGVLNSLHYMPEHRTPVGFSTRLSPDESELFLAIADRL